MSKKKAMRVELRYYEIPPNESVLALYGDGWKRNYGHDVDVMLHFHNLLEIGICHYGHGQLVIDGGIEHRYGAGVCTAFPRNIAHTTLSDGADICFWEFLFIDLQQFVQNAFPHDPLFAHELIARVSLRPIVTSEKEHPEYAAAIRDVVKEMSGEREYRAEVVHGLVLRLLLEIARMNPREVGVEQPAREAGLNRINAALDYVAAHYAEEIRVEELADCCGMSETHFRRLFTDFINMTPVEYINLVRIEHACERLKNSDDTMEEIALKTGFLSQATFNRNFKKIVGLPPYQWKKQSDNYDARLQDYRITVHRGWVY